MTAQPCAPTPSHDPLASWLRGVAHVLLRWAAGRAQQQALAARRRRVRRLRRERRRAQRRAQALARELARRLSPRLRRDLGLP